MKWKQTKANVTIYPVGAKPHQGSISSNLKNKYKNVYFPGGIHPKNKKKYKMKPTLSYMERRIGAGGVDIVQQVLT